MYALVDCNNFYVSCERLFRPDLIGKPVVVLSNNDGCIISRSDEAKSFGIAMGAPEFKVRSQLADNNITVFSSNYPLYGDLSTRVMGILRQFTPAVEPYSIDEAFLDLSGILRSDYHEFGMEIRNRINKWVGIPVCVGIAPSKALAKIANKIARKYPGRTNGAHVIDNDEKRIKALKWTQIEDVWGIGYRLKKKLRDKGIETALDFCEPKHETLVKSLMGVTGLRLKSELEGKPVLEMQDVSDRKSIATTRSFPKKLTEFDPLRERVATFASVSAEKLRKQHSSCHTIMVMLGTLEHKTAKSKVYYQQATTLPFATQSTLTIVNEAVKLLERIFEVQQGQKFHKAGVILTQLIPEDEKQFDLFTDENPKHLPLMKAMDQINKKLGGRVVKLGVQGDKTWDMRQEKLSPRYTTNFNEIMTINAGRK